MLRSSLQQHGPLRHLLGCLRAVSTSAGASQAQPAQQASDTIEVFVNDEPVNIPKGSTVLQACDAAGIDIPRCAPARCCCGRSGMHTTTARAAAAGLARVGWSGVGWGVWASQQST
jgi:hypothetical protein